MVDKVSNLTNKRPIVDESGILTQEARLYFNTVSELLMVTGQGNPEGVVSARVGSLYTDTNWLVGSILYIKKLPDIGGDTSQGWFIV